MTDTEEEHHIYENVGEAQDADHADDGWSSSEFEEFDEDQCSVGAGSQNSQESADRRGATKNKKLFRRKVPARLSLGKSAADVQSMVSSD